MPDELPPPTTDSPPTNGSPLPVEPTDQPAGLAAVARRVSRRTTDLLAISIIGIGIFAVSGRLSDWWNTPPEAVLAPSRIVPEVVGSDVAWPEMDIPVGLNLGDLPVNVERLQIQGDRNQLERIVFGRLRSVLNSTQPPLPDGTETRITKAAAKLERLLSGISPVEERPDAWRIYRLDEPGTPGFSATFLGTRPAVGPTAGMTEPRTERLVVWAMAMPWRQDEWKVFFFQAAHGSTSRFAIPPDAELTMSMREPSSAELTAFRAKAASASLSSWREFYSRSLVEAGWKPAREWTQSESRSASRFENDSHAVELNLKYEGSQLSGLANVIRLPGRTSK
ncbi:MAG: hypothetical protein O2820_07270 [Planctomycetota bacterium]|nr:hypothetical protein [Planctomycetota bacterium]MDA1249010.1 hypothetical protein [Planctomycetota bacterium]